MAGRARDGGEGVFNATAYRMYWLQHHVIVIVPCERMPELGYSGRVG